MSLALLDLIRKEVAVGRVSEQTHPAFPHLSIFKYTETCAFEDGWNPINRMCRGIILNNVTGELIARSFPKFFNIGERPESSLEKLPNEPFEVFEKMDGSMGSLYKLPTGEWAVATPGSMDSPQAREATKMLSEYIPELIPDNVTPVVEIIYPENRVVVDYNDVRALCLLAVFNRDGTEWSYSDVVQLAERCGFEIVKRHDHTDLANLPFEENAEGYVIRFASGLRVKAKSPVYVMAHRFLTNVSIPRVVEALRDGSIVAVAAQCPPTWRLVLDDLMALVQNRYNKIQTEITEYWKQVSCFNPTDGPSYDPKVWRKQSAIWIQANVPTWYQAGVFQLISNKEPTEWLWKTVEIELLQESKSTNV
jgi:RNA ligase